MCMLRCRFCCVISASATCWRESTVFSGRHACEWRRLWTAHAKLFTLKGLALTELISAAYSSARHGIRGFYLQACIKGLRSECYDDTSVKTRSFSASYLPKKWFILLRRLLKTRSANPYVCRLGLFASMGTVHMIWTDPTEGYRRDE
jgi:hypothetical protein